MSRPPRPPRRYSRLDRVNQALREVIADELELIDDDRLELVTVMGVKVEADLRRAVVWFSAPPPRPVDDAATAAALAEHRVRLQASVARQLRLRRTPELEFRPDPAREQGSIVEDILRDLRERGPREERDD